MLSIPFPGLHIFSDVSVAGDEAKFDLHRVDTFADITEINKYNFQRKPSSVKEDLAQLKDQGDSICLEECIQRNSRILHNLLYLIPASFFSLLTLLVFQISS